MAISTNPKPTIYARRRLKLSRRTNNIGIDQARDHKVISAYLMYFSPHTRHVEPVVAQYWGSIEDYVPKLGQQEN